MKYLLVILATLTLTANAAELPACGKPNEIYMVDGVKRTIPVCPRYKDYPSLPPTYIVVRKEKDDVVQKAIDELIKKEPKITIVESKETY